MTRNQSDTGVGLTTGTKAGTAEPIGVGENLTSTDTNKADQPNRAVKGGGTHEPQDRAAEDPAHIPPSDQG